MKKRLITEKDVLKAAKETKILIVPKNALITSLARDAAKEKQVKFADEQTVAPVSTGAIPANQEIKTIIIGADHGGFFLKSELIPWLKSLNYQVEDAGTTSDAAVDYPDYAFAVGYKVKQTQSSIGIMIDGAGIGSAMALNKMPGILAACCYNEFTARNARQHNHANVLTLGSKALGSETCKSVVLAFLKSVPEPGRHEARVKKIRDIEAKYTR